jgi:23S rRNA (cytosine1962-C5)-methyltransferase
MPGLIVDIYGSTAVMQCHSVGMYLIRQTLAELIISEFKGIIKSVYDKSSGTLPFKSGINPKDGYLIGGEESDALLENGNKFEVSWVEGQKTGFFIDQRENRQLLQNYSKGKTVLNTFGYTGGFSVYALRGGASKTITVDSSQKAIDLTKKNVELNFGETPNHEAVCLDVFEFIRSTTEKFDIIILDPPAFAKHNEALRNALQAYKRLNAAAIDKLNPGGLLFTFSCSQVVNKENFRNAVFSGCAMTGRKVRILHQLTQPADHPINIYHPEGEYLKGLVLQVE